MIFVLLLMLAAPDLTGIKAEPDLEKRADLALVHADEELDAAREAYKAGNLKQMKDDLQEVGGAAQLALDSLEQAHKPARKSNHYKRAELKTRALLRRLASLSDDVSIDDRPAVEEVRQHIQEVHDRLLSAIMSNQK